MSTRRNHNKDNIFVAHLVAGHFEVRHTLAGLCYDFSSQASEQRHALDVFAIYSNITSIANTSHTSSALPPASALLSCST